MQHRHRIRYLFKTETTIKPVRISFGDEADPEKAIPVQTCNQLFHNSAADPFVLILFLDCNVLEVGIADPITQGSSHAYDFVPIQNDHEAMAAANKPLHKLRAIRRFLPPPGFMIQSDQLLNLISGGGLEKSKDYAVL